MTACMVAQVNSISTHVSRDASRTSLSTSYLEEIMVGGRARIRSVRVGVSNRMRIVHTTFLMIMLFLTYMYLPEMLR